MATTLSPQAAPFQVLSNGRGRYSLWPGAKSVPSGWTVMLPPASKRECLDFITRNCSAPDARRATVAFSLMFFGGDEGQAAGDKYRTVIEAARFADTHKFEAIWLPERHFTFMGSLYPNPVVLMAALARETKNLRLRAGSVVLPLHDPVRVAEEWAVVDNLSAGRVEISFAPGWNAEDFVLSPDHYADRYQVMYEGIKLIEELWSGRTIERTDGEGKSFHFRTYPTPVQPALCKWITVAGSERSFRQAGQAGAHLLTHLFDQDTEALADKIKIYREARAQAGFDAMSGKVAVALHTYLASSMETVMAEAHGPYCEYLKTNVHLIDKLARSRGIPVDISRLEPEQLDQAVHWLFEKFFRSRSLLGTPESCTELVTRLAAAGVQEIACLLDFGPSRQAILNSLPALAQLKERFQCATTA
jgi:phthiocerol/phenolphthiocerol synthesis type-I polyketide synthase D